MSALKISAITFVLFVTGVVGSFIFTPGMWFADYHEASARYEQMLEFGEQYSFRSSKVQTAAAIALVAQEDRRIYSREILGLSIPVDIRSCGRAMLINLKAGRVRQGCSTLAMQLGKLAMKKEQRQRKLWMKLYQLRLSFKSITKDPDTIVSAFLLHLPCASSHAAGLSACSLLRFNKALENLTEAEAMVLASAVQAPGRDLQITAKSKKRARTRLARVLNTAWEIGLLSSRQAKEIYRQPVKLLKANLDLINAAHAGRDLALTEKLVRAVKRAKKNALRKQGERDAPDLLVLGAIFNAQGKLLAYAGGDESWLDRKIEAGSWVKPFLVKALLDHGAGENYLSGNVKIPLSLPLYTRTFQPYKPRNAGKEIPARAVPMQYIMQSINTATLATALYSFIYMEPARVKRIVRKFLSAKERRKYNTQKDRQLSLKLASNYSAMELSAEDVGQLPGYRQITLASTRMTMNAMREYVPSLEVPHEDLAVLLGVVRAPWRDMVLGLHSLWTNGNELSRTAKLMKRYSGNGTLAWMKKIKRQPPEVYKTATAERNAGLAILIYDHCNPAAGPYLATFLALRPSGKAITPVQGGTLGPAYLDLEDDCLSGRPIMLNQKKVMQRIFCKKLFCYLPSLDVCL